MGGKEKKEVLIESQLVNFIINELEVVHLLTGSPPPLLAGDVGLGARPLHFQ